MPWDNPVLYRSLSSDQSVAIGATSSQAFRLQADGMFYKMIVGAPEDGSGDELICDISSFYADWAFTGGITTNGTDRLVCGVNEIDPFTNDGYMLEFDFDGNLLNSIFILANDGFFIPVVQELQTLHGTGNHIGVNQALWYDGFGFQVRRDIVMVSEDFSSTSILRPSNTTATYAQNVVHIERTKNGNFWSFCEEEDATYSLILWDGDGNIVDDSYELPVPYTGSGLGIDCDGNSAVFYLDAWS